MESMKTPRTRAEFERNFFLLREQIRQQKVHMAEGMSLGLEKVRSLPNGRIDFLSVDEFARLQANMMASFTSDNFHEMMKSKQIEGEGQDGGGPSDHPAKSE
jgi:hypothetical protein